MPEIETINDQAVACRMDGKVVILAPKHLMDKETALRLAAWLVVIVGDPDRFDEILNAVLKT